MRKKFISLFLVFSLLFINCAYLNTVEEKREKILMEKKEKRKLGAKLWIQKKDGKLIQGELIAVKQTSLLLLESKSAEDVSIDIRDINIITVENWKSGFWKGASIGALIGAGSGALIAIVGMIASNNWEWAGIIGVFAGCGVPVGFIIGGIAGTSSTAKYKEIQIAVMSQNEIERILKKLRRRARIKDYK